MKEVLLIKAQQQSRQKDFYRDLMLSSIQARHKLYLSRITKSSFSDLITRISLSICVRFLFSQP